MRSLILLAFVGYCLADINDQPCVGRGGTCQADSGACGGAYFSGMCSGAANRRCCIPGGDGADTACHSYGGVCSASSCPSGAFHSGFCGGGSERRCCIPARPASNQYCYNRLCSTNANNEARQCDAQGCGYFNAPRGSRAHGGVDVRCVGGATIYAPFSGTVVRDSPPYGDGRCCDKGFTIQGTGTHSGWQVMMFYINRSVSIGSSFSKGQAIATHIGLHCGCYSSTMTDHVHYQIYKPGSGTTTDPTQYVYCTSPGEMDDPHHNVTLF